MKLSDIMSNAGLSSYAEIALVLFVAVFIIETLRTFAPSRRAELRETSMLPLDDGTIIAHTAEPSSAERRAAHALAAQEK